MSPIFLWACWVALAIIATLIISSSKRERQPIQVNIPPVPQEETVTCETCKCLVRQTDAAVVNVSELWNLYYCQSHKPNYDFRAGGAFYKTVPSHRVEVTKDGKEIKSKERSA